jgi:hypothetical protein
MKCTSRSDECHAPGAREGGEPRSLSVGKEIGPVLCRAGLHGVCSGRAGRRGAGQTVLARA